MGRLTTHVLDTALGRPARDVPVRLHRLRADGPELVAEARTNGDGRCDAPLLEGEAFTPGEYELVFGAGDYLERTAPAGAGARAPFLDDVPVRFRVVDAAEHYHVPLLLSPFGYSTYRGS